MGGGLLKRSIYIYMCLFFCMQAARVCGGVGEKATSLCNLYQIYSGERELNFLPSTDLSPLSGEFGGPCELQASSDAGD